MYYGVIQIYKSHLPYTHFLSVTILSTGFFAKIWIPGLPKNLPIFFDLLFTIFLTQWAYITLV